MWKVVFVVIFSALVGLSEAYPNGVLIQLLDLNTTADMKGRCQTTTSDRTVFKHIPGFGFQGIFLFSRMK